TPSPTPSRTRAWSGSGWRRAMAEGARATEVDARVAPTSPDPARQEVAYLTWAAGGRFFDTESLMIENARPLPPPADAAAERLELSVFWLLVPEARLAEASETARDPGRAAEVRFELLVIEGRSEAVGGRRRFVPERWVSREET